VPGRDRIGERAAFDLGPRAVLGPVRPAAARHHDEVGIANHEVVERTVGFDGEPVTRRHPAGRFERIECDVEIGPGFGSVFEHLVGADRVEFVEPLVEHDRHGFDRACSGHAIGSSARGKSVEHLGVQPIVHAGVREARRETNRKRQYI